MKLPINAEVAAGLKQGVVLGAAVLVLIAPQVGGPRVESLPASAPAPLAAAPAPRHADFAGEPAGDDVRAVADWVVNARDNGQHPFVIIDKRQAHVFVFHTDGRLLSSTPVLLGSAAGDDSVPGIGQRPIADVKPEERTTPAGRFESQRGRNTGGEDIIWVDYEAAVSMHRVRLNNPKERRAERLASPAVADNRISYGCINMPVRFFEDVLWPNFQSQRGIVYVLPEVKALQTVFPGVPALQAARQPGGLPPAASPSVARAGTV